MYQKSALKTSLIYYILCKDVRQLGRREYYLYLRFSICEFSESVEASKLDELKRVTAEQTAKTDARRQKFQAQDSVLAENCSFESQGRGGGGNEPGFEEGAATKNADDEEKAA